MFVVRPFGCDNFDGDIISPILTIPPSHADHRPFHPHRLSQIILSSPSLSIIITIIFASIIIIIIIDLEDERNQRCEVRRELRAKSSGEVLERKTVGELRERGEEEGREKKGERYTSLMIHVTKLWTDSNQG